MAVQHAGATDTSIGNVDALREAARLMGQVSTQAKAAAARENGKRGGRPKGIPMSPEARRKISEAKRTRTAQGPEPSASDLSPISLQ